MQIYIIVYIIHPCETSKIKSVNVHVQELFRSGSYKFNIHACKIDIKS